MSGSSGDLECDFDTARGDSEWWGCGREYQSVLRSGIYITQSSVSVSGLRVSGRLKEAKK